MKKCLRCGEEFTDPIPKVTNPEGEITDIATNDWCSNCNAILSSVLFRERSAYQVLMLKSTRGALGFSGMPKIMTPHEEKIPYKWQKSDD